jgi:uncharacterized membrane protein
MTGLQKGFLFRIAVAFLTVGAFLGIYFVAGNPYAANAAWALLALLAFEKRVRGDQTVDERDEGIIQRATLFGYSVFWVVFVSCSVVAAVVMSPGSIPAQWLVFIPLAGFWLLEVARASAGLALYGRVGG